MKYCNITELVLKRHLFLIFLNIRKRAGIYTGYFINNLNVDNFLFDQKQTSITIYNFIKLRQPYIHVKIKFLNKIICNVYRLRLIKIFLLTKVGQ